MQKFSIFSLNIRPCGRSLLTTSCRNAGFFRKDRSADIAELEAAATKQQSQPAIKRPLPVSRDRELGARVSCSDRRVAPRQAWIESLASENVDDAYLDPPCDLVDLHPDVFAVFPRLDLVHKNLYWQAHYRLVDWRCITTRADLLYRSRRKPWPQKGTGRARHGNRRTHIWVGGGQCHGPRGPESFFSVLPYHVRLTGLLSMLTSKHAQGDLHIVEDLSLSDELERDAKSIYTLANSRAAQKLRSMAEYKDASNADERQLLERFKDRLSLTDDIDTPNSSSADETKEVGVLAALEREREETEEFLDLIKGGKAAEAAKLAYKAADYLRRLVDSRSWGPSVLFITEEESFLGKDAESTSGLAMALGCASYSQYIDAEVAPESAVEGPPNNSPFAAPRALHPGRGLTLMPVQGLNVWSMVQHDTLVLTRSALDVLETRLLAAQRRISQFGMQRQRQELGKCEGPPLVDDWLMDERVFGQDDVRPDPLRARHFSPTTRLGDANILRKTLQ